MSTVTDFFPLHIRSVKQETRDAMVITLQPDWAHEAFFYFLPGQYLTVRAWIEGEEVRRSYSICSGPGEPLRIAVKRVQGGLFSNWIQDWLRDWQAHAKHEGAGGNRGNGAGGRPLIGGVKHLLPPHGAQATLRSPTLECMPPLGHFHRPLGDRSVEAAPARHHVAFAAGSGITPVFALAKHILAVEPQSHFTLIYGNRATASILFREELADLKDRYLERFILRYVMSREQMEADLFQGRIDEAHCNALLDHWLKPASIDWAWLCGPTEMMEAVEHSLCAHGVPKEQIRLERFIGNSSNRRAARVEDGTKANVASSTACAVTVIRDGRSQHFLLHDRERSVLEQALVQGIDLPYSCKGGVCSTCRCKRISGEVEMNTIYGLEAYEVERGFILPCQTYALDAQLVIDYDQET